MTTKQEMHRQQIAAMKGIRNAYNRAIRVEETIHDELFEVVTPPVIDPPIIEPPITDPVPPTVYKPTIQYPTFDTDGKYRIGKGTYVGVDWTIVNRDKCFEIHKQVSDDIAQDGYDFVCFYNRPDFKHADEIMQLYVDRGVQIYLSTMSYRNNQHAEIAKTWSDFSTITEWANRDDIDVWYLFDDVNKWIGDIDDPTLLPRLYDFFRSVLPDALTYSTGLAKVPYDIPAKYSDLMGNQCYPNQYYSSHVWTYLQTYVGQNHPKPYYPNLDCYRVNGYFPDPDKMYVMGWTALAFQPSALHWYAYWNADNSNLANMPKHRAMINRVHKEMDEFNEVLMCGEFVPMEDSLLNGKPQNWLSHSFVNLRQINYDNKQYVIVTNGHPKQEMSLTIDRDFRMLFGNAEPVNGKISPQSVAVLELD